MASLPSSKLMWGAFSLIFGLTCLLVGNSIFHANSVGGPVFGSMIMLFAAFMLVIGLTGLFPYHPRYLMLCLEALERMVKRGGKTSGVFG